MAVAGECSATRPTALGFELTDLGGPDAAQSRHAVLRGRPLERVQASDLLGVHGDDQLAARLERQPVLGAVLLEQPPTAGAQLGLEAAGR
jgi:hypothetical protein